MSKIRNMARRYTIARALAPLALAATALAAITLAGCSRVAVLRSVQPEFTAESLRQGKLAVLGVVQKDEITQVRGPLTESLEHVLTISRKDIPLIPWHDVLAAIDDSTERFLLLGYQYQGVADPTWLRRAADSLHAAARYGILVRVESERIRFAERWVVLPPRPGEPAEETQVRVAGRDVVITAVVYDLQTLAPVLSGKYQGFGESAAMPDTLPPPEDRPPIEGWSTPEDRAAEVQPPPPGTPPPGRAYPQPPSVPKAAEAAFTNLAGSLPGAEPPPASTAPK